MSPKQCKMARAGLGWTVSELAQRAGTRSATISNFERGGTALTTTAKTLKKAILSTGRVTFSGDSCVCVESECNT
ncbi:helix-turn-helix domain-containing protein [Nitrosomonas aestuarii]|uniref:helix-turn-helix domain-containing protein n=1 Tax=Nitrosomonas aestuarii TaxID=52441 RepID=UPI001114390C